MTGEMSHKDIPVRERLIFAMDVADTDAARRLTERLGDSVGFYKLGLELFMAGGYFELLDWMVNRGKKVFVDLKFFDVPATVAAAVAPAAQPRRRADDRARQPGDHGSRRRRQGRREGARRDGADEPRPRRPGRPRFRLRRRRSSCCRARGARSRQVATAWCPPGSRRRCCGSTSTGDCWS